MGKVSVAQMAQVPGSSSREVFQGLFKDLGMQAMALETILRAVCGRVDKLENWLTEVSFGMTELDLKLRNIAHNIDGTAAVDDEAQGPLRWAIPSTDDVKPVAPTVSKKLGTDKKAVRVTGMAAAILDRLATAGSNGSTPVEDEKVEKSGVKKKSKEKKHGTKKAKANGLPDVPVTPSPAIVEIAPPPAIPLVAESKQTLMLKTEPEHGHSVEAAEQKQIVSTSVSTLDEIPAPLEQEKTIMNGNTELAQTKESTQSENSSSVKSPAMPATEMTKRDVPKKAPVVSSLFPTVQMERTVEPFVLKGTAHTTPEVIPPPNINPAPTASIPDPLPFQTVPPTEPPKPSVVKPEVEASEVLPSDNESNVISVSNDVAVAEVQNLTRPATPPLIVPQPSIKQTESQPVQPVVVTQSPASVPSTTSTIKVSLPKSPISKPNDDTLMDQNGVSTMAVLHASLSSKTEPNVTAAPEPAVVVNKAFKAGGMPIRAPLSSPQTKSLSPHDSETTEPATDPLVPHRTSVHRRSSKMAPRPSFSKRIDNSNESEASRRLSGNMRGSNSRRTSIVLPAQVIENDPQQPVEELTQTTQQPEPQAPIIQSIPQVSAPPVASPSTDTAEQTDIIDESSESGSESSSNDSESSSADEEHENDAEAGAAVEEISKTMIALKKLKKAHMLSPEEEVELKERAHKKWFQLKGHIKEKQKKDVTNILLKRKKNVFTVSSRIELLEEKSREIFAALKQITTDMREKNDLTTHETLRRRVFDIEQSLLNVDSRIASLSAPASEKMNDLESEVVSLRNTVQLQLTTAQTEAEARHFFLEEALVNHRALVEALAQDIPAQLSVQAELFSEKLKQLPDYHAAIENLKRSLRRKADLKLLKELEARLLGLDAENEDCLVRCLSCHKEVTHPYNEIDTREDEQESGGSQLRKVNPGPSSARIYRSNVPFNAQPVVQESISEEFSDEALFSPHQTLMQPQYFLPVTQEIQAFQQHQSAGDSFSSEKPPGVRVPSVKWSTPPMEISLKKVIKPPQASPLSLMNVTATRAILSPDRPISAPIIALKKKANGAARAKSLLKSLSPQPEPPQ